MHQLVLKALAETPEEGLSGNPFLGSMANALSKTVRLLRVLDTLTTSTPSLLLIVASRLELEIPTSESYKSITHFLRLPLITTKRPPSFVVIFATTSVEIVKSIQRSHLNTASWPEEQAFISL